MSPEPHNSVEVFYSYAHEDEKLRDELKKHLANLKRQGVITEWYDRDISAGSEWNEEIERHLNSAKVILLLISPDFMNSDYINDMEVKWAMERHESGEARVIPVILRPVDWEGAPFSKLQSLPSNVRPVTLWKNQDEAFLDVTAGIRTAIQRLSDPSVSIFGGLEIPGPPKVGFVSRKDRDSRDIVERMHNELSTHTNQLFVLWGAGGVGKTAIAAEAARALIEPFAKRIVWVSADGLESFSLTTLLDGIATQLGHSDLRKLALDLKKEQVRDLVRTPPTLIVLDNFETIEPAERKNCVEWLGKPAPCTSLITTRDVIEDARNIPVEDMRLEEANALLDQLITQAHDARAFAKLDRDRVIQTAEANPLVLQWIVGQVDLAQDPDEVLDDLRHGEGSAAERVFNRSFELKQLNNGGRAVLLALSLFAPSAMRKAVAEVSGFGKESDKRKFRDAVKSLSALWLIHTMDESKRLAVEGLTRELTKARLNADPRGKTFRFRFVTRFLRHAEAHSQKTREDYDALEMDKDNLSTAMDVAFSQMDWQSVLRLASVVAPSDLGMFSVRGYWDEGLRLGQLALKAASFTKSNLAIASWSHNLGMTYQDRGELEEARRLFDKSLEISQKLGSEQGIATTLHHLARLAQDHGEFEEARKLYSESLRISKKLRHQTGIASTLHELAWNAHERGDLVEAKGLYDESLEMERKSGNEWGIAITLYQLANLAKDRGELSEARCLYYQSLEIEKRLGSQKGIAVNLQGLGELYILEGIFDKAEEPLQKSLTILRQLGDRQNHAKCLKSIGQLRVAQGRLPVAMDLFGEALELAESLRSPLLIGNLKHSLGLLTEKQGDHVRAAPLLREALMIFEKLPSPKAEDVRRDLARVEGKAS